MQVIRESFGCDVWDLFSTFLYDKHNFAYKFLWGFNSVIFTCMFQDLTFRRICSRLFLLLWLHCWEIGLFGPISDLLFFFFPTVLLLIVFFQSAWYGNFDSIMTTTLDWKKLWWPLKLIITYSYIYTTRSFVNHYMYLC